MEFGRFAQIERLKNSGWYEDAETTNLGRVDAISGVCGGPSFLKDKAGRVHTVSCDVETLLHGSHQIAEGEHIKKIQYHQGIRR